MTTAIQPVRFEGKNGWAELYCADCLDLLPIKADAVVKNGLNVTTPYSKIGHEKAAIRKPKTSGSGGNILGITSGRDSEFDMDGLVAGADCGLFQCKSDTHQQGAGEIKDQIQIEGESRVAQRAIQGRNTEHALSADDREGQMREVWSNGETGDSPQEQRSLRQPSSQSSGALLAVPQSHHKNSLLETDSREWCVVSDPPYGIRYVHGEGGGCLAKSTIFAGHSIIGDDSKFDPSPWLEFKVVVLWGANHYASRLPDSPAWLIWDKRDGICSNDQADCEMAWTNLKKPARVFRHIWNGMLKDSERGESRVHPTQKPAALMAWCLEQAKVPSGATVLDPFMGSGTTGIACLRTGRNFIGIEKDPAHFKTACERFAREIDGELL